MTTTPVSGSTEFRFDLADLGFDSTEFRTAIVWDHEFARVTVRPDDGYHVEVVGYSREARYAKAKLETCRLTFTGSTPAAVVLAAIKALVS